MSLSSYTVEEGRKIRLTAGSGSAQKGFSGPSGTYNIQVYVETETDGRPTLSVYKGSTKLRDYTYPLGSSIISFPISNVALKSGETIRLVGSANGGARARVDKVVLTQVSTSTPTTTTPTTTTPTTTTPAPSTSSTAPATSGSPAPMTIEAEGMTLSSYAVENGSKIKLTASSGSAQKAFAGASGTYNMQVYVETETDGQPTLSVYKGSTKLRDYTYPLGSSIVSFPINNVSLQAGETIRLVGTANRGAWARVDKIALTPVSTSTPTPSPTPSTTTPSPTTPSTTTPTSPSTTTPSTTSPTTPIIGDALASATPVTMEAEAMSLSSYAVESGRKIKLTASSGSAQKTFLGTSGTYNVQVYVETETDGTPTLSVYKGSTKLRDYTYPRGSSIVNFAINNVALNSGDTIRLVGKQNGGAMARVDKLVFSPTAVAAPTPAPTSPTPAPAPTSPAPSTQACANPSGGYEGFGRNTTGGAGQPIYRVTNLNDSGAGSLRDALSQGNRCVVFDVAGTISLSGLLLVKGANVTIDGFTAPAPGITLRNRAFIVQGSSGARNVVVRGIRHHGTVDDDDAMRAYNTSNVVFDHVSVHGYRDGAIDVTENSRDVLIQWSIFGFGGEGTLMNKPTLVASGTTRVTMHHNLYFQGDYRNPRCSGNGTLPTDPVCDIRNNVIWNYGGDGTQVGTGGTANIINNYYYSTKVSSGANAIRLESTPASMYVSGNRSQNGWDLEGKGNRSTPFPAIEPVTTDALTAARQVVAQAGARGPRFGLDEEDLKVIGQISLP